MALSGTILGSTVGKGYRLEIDWSATQDIANNKSTVTAKVYWCSLSSYYTVNSSATKTGTTKIDGTTYSWSVSGADLNANQRRLLATKSKTVSHAADGTKKLTISATFDCEVTLSGTFYSSVSASDSVTLNTIPRASSLTSDADWTAGSNFTLSVSRASTSFTHTAQIYVNGVLIKSITGIGTSASSGFDVDNNTDIFAQLNGAVSRGTKITLITYNGSTRIGSKDYTGTCTSPAASTASPPSSFAIGSSFSVGINRANSGFTHTIKLKNKATNAEYLSYVNQGTSCTVATSGKATDLYNATKTSNSLALYIECTTYYNGKIVRTATTKDVTATVTNSNPNMSGVTITYEDTNPTTSRVTGNPQYIVQKQSTLKATLNTGATGVNGATISSYTVTVNGVKPVAIAVAGSVTLGSVDASSNVNITITAKDSRGNSNTANFPVNIIPYAPPSISTTAKRTDGYGDSVTLTLSGTASAVNIGGVNKNKIVTATYITKKRTATSYVGTPSNFTISGFPNFAASNVPLTLANDTAWDIQVVVKDDIGGDATVPLAVNAGKPVFFIDFVKNSLGFNDYPSNDNEFLFNGTLRFGANKWGSKGGAINMNNGDIVEANGIYFRDISDNGGEGLLFLKSGKPEASTNINDYETFYIRDGYFYFDNNDYMYFKYGDSNGSGVGLGAGGLTVVGGGEAMKTTFAQSGLSAALEELHLGSDNNVLIHSNMQNGWTSRKQWSFRTDGTLATPGDVNAGGVVRSGNLAMNGYNTFENTAEVLYLKSPKGIDLAEADGCALNLDTDATGPRVLSMAFFNRTYPYATNAYITSNGVLGRSTSARKYKMLEEEIDEAEAYKLLNINPKTWYDKKAVEAYADALAEGVDITKTDNELLYLERIPGIVAEDVEAVGLSRFVSYGGPDEEGNREVEGLMYDRLWVLLIPIVRNLIKQVDYLEGKLKRR